MIVKPFKYVAADSLEKAGALLKEHGEEAAVMAGGTDLLGGLKDAIRDNSPALVIGLKPVRDLDYVKVEAAGVRIGALTTIAEIAKHPEIRQSYPLLSQAALSVASPQIRNVATIAGNICQEPRCWYYRNPDNTFDCLRKGGNRCDALFAENRYHSIFGGMSVSDAPCVNGCPINNGMPRYMAKLRAGHVDEAADILLQTNPLPAITGRVCPHPCEQECNRTGFDDPVAIRDVERYLGDHVLAHPSEFYVAPKKESGKKVAVVGAGPAGLSAAYFLRKQGHQVTVYDRMPEAGGMLTYSIPAYRLPKAVVKAQVAALEGMGIRFELGKAIGDKDLSLADLRARYDSVFLATGLWKGKTLRLEREELLESGLEFLIDLQRGVPRQVGRKVLVIGGGSVAVDVAISAKRLGAREVMMACLESMDIIPAIPEDIEQANAEGIEINCSWGPNRVLERDGKLIGMEFVRCTSVFDETGCFAPEFDKTEKATIEVDQILVAIGQGADLSYAGPELKMERGFITSDKETGATSVDGVFAGGDAAGGQAAVVRAMASGKRAAAGIDDYLAGVAGVAPATKQHTSLAINGEALKISPRAQTPRLPLPDRTIRGEDAATVSQEAMTDESWRCANCGCVAVNASDMAPALVALGAKVRTTKRTLAAEELFTTPECGTTVLEPDELVQEIEIPASAAGGRQAYLKFRIRNAIDFPIVGAAFRSDVKDGRFHNPRVVLGAVAPVPLRMRQVEALLEGQMPGEALGQEAGRLAAGQAQPLARNRFKVEIVKALLGKLGNMSLPS